MNSDEASDHGEDRCVEESEEGEDEDECGAQQCEGAIPQYTCRPCCTQPAGDGSPLHYLDTFPTRKHTFPTPEHLTKIFHFTLNLHVYNTLIVSLSPSQSMGTPSLCAHTYTHKKNVVSL